MWDWNEVKRRDEDGECHSLDPPRSKPQEDNLNASICLRNKNQSASKEMYQFSTPIVADYHKFGSLKQYKLILLQYQR